MAAKACQQMIESHCFLEFRGGKRFCPGFYVFGFEEAVKVKRLKTEVREHQRGGVSGPLGAPASIERKMIAALWRAASLRKVVQ